MTPADSRITSELDTSPAAERPLHDAVATRSRNWTFELEVHSVNSAAGWRLNARINEAILALLVWADAPGDGHGDPTENRSAAAA